MTTYVYRSLAADHARAQGLAAFRTQMDKDEMWKAVYEPGEKASAAFADAQVAAQESRNSFTHGEVTWVGGATGDEDPHPVPVLIARVPLHDLDKVGTVRLDRTLARAWFTPNGGDQEFLCEPAYGHRWTVFAPAVGQQPVRHNPREVHPGDRVETPRRVGSATGPTREPSRVGSPTKRVWEIADSMPGAPRRDVIAACVEAGINPSTASVQYSAWNKARAASQ